MSLKEIKHAWKENIERNPLISFMSRLERIQPQVLILVLIGSNFSKEMVTI